MKKNWKLYAVLAALIAVLVAATACFPVPVQAPSETPSDSPAVASESAMATESAAATETPSADPEPTFSYAPGTLTDTDYQNESLGIQWSIPEGSDLIMATSEELASMVEQSLEEEGETLGGEDTYEMMATAPSGSPNIIVMTEKLALSNITLDQYAATVTANIASDGSYSPSGDPEPVTIAGMDFLKVAMDIEVDGASASQDYYFAKVGDRVIGFILSYLPDDADACAAIIDAFQPYPA